MEFTSQFSGVLKVWGWLWGRGVWGWLRRWRGVVGLGLSWGSVGARGSVGFVGGRGGWLEGEGAVGAAGDFFAVEVDADVVAAPAQQAGVLEGGLAAVAPVLVVVDLADLLGGAAADAAAVAGDELFPQSRRDFAFGSPQQRFAGVFVEDAGEDLGVARQRQRLGLGEGRVVGQAGVDDLFAHGVVVGEDDHLGAGRRALTVAVADEFCERVRGSLRGRGAVLGVLAAEQLVALGQQRGADAVAGERVELGEQTEHAVLLLADRGAAPAPLGGPPRLEFLFADGVVDHLFDGAAQLVLGFGLRGVEQRPLVQRRLGGGVEDQTRRLGGDRPVGEPAGHVGGPIQLSGHLHGFARPGAGPLLVAAQDFLGRLVALPAGDLRNHLRLARRDRRARPPHRTQTVTQHRQVRLPQRHRRREQPLPQRRPLPAGAGTTNAGTATNTAGATNTADPYRPAGVTAANRPAATATGVRLGGTVTGETGTGAGGAVSAARLGGAAPATTGGAAAGDSATGVPQILAHLAITPFVSVPRHRRPSAANAPCHYLSTI